MRTVGDWINKVGARVEPNDDRTFRSTGAAKSLVADGMGEYIADVAWLSPTQLPDSVGADFQLVRKLTNYVCAKLPE